MRGNRKIREAMTFFLFLLITFALLSSRDPAKVSAEGTTTYYIDAVNGDDENAGTSADAAWQTAAKIGSMDFKPGDSILFAGGQIHTIYTLAFDRNDRGTMIAPITISSYGEGSATLSSGNLTGIYLGDTAGFSISNLKLIGSGRDTNNGDGISLWNGSGGAVEYLHIENVEITGYQKSGVFLGVNGGAHTFHNAVIKDCLIYEIGGNGICTWGGDRNSIDHLRIEGTVIYDISAVPGEPDYLGNGIVLGMVHDAEITGCVAYECGSAPMNGAGCVGIWCYESDNVMIQKNESFNNITTQVNGVDGGGFDFDQYTTNSCMQYNYSHNNHGAGYLLCANGTVNETFANNIVRYNISVNDGRRSAYGAITLYGKVKDTQIYHNTVYVEPSDVDLPGENPKGIYIWNHYMEYYDAEDVAFLNNIIQTTDGLPLVYMTPGQADGSKNIIFQGNCYYSTGDDFVVNWGRKIYHSLEEMRLDGLEMMDNVETGICADPMLTEVGAEPTFGTPWGSRTLTAYQILPDSPCVDAGVKLTELDMDTGDTDYWGNDIRNITRCDIGAYETGIDMLAAPSEGEFRSIICSTGGKAVSQVFTIKNTGRVELTDLRVGLNGQDADTFIINTDELRETLAAGEETSFVVSVNDEVLKNGTASVQIMDGSGLTEAIELRSIVSEHDISAELQNVMTATCTEEGYTGDRVCLLCGEVLEKGKTTVAMAHEYTDGSCEICGNEDPNLNQKEIAEEGTASDNPEDKNNNHALRWIIPAVVIITTGIFLVIRVAVKKRKR